jgi:hypothetical protein
MTLRPPKEPGVPDRDAVIGTGLPTQLKLPVTPATRNPSMARPA